MPKVTVTAKCLKSPHASYTLPLSHSLEVGSDVRLATLKAYITLRTRIPADQLRFVHKGKSLDDVKTVADLGADPVIHWMVKAGWDGLLVDAPASDAPVPVATPETSAKSAADKKESAAKEAVKPEFWPALKTFLAEHVDAAQMPAVYEAFRQAYQRLVETEVQRLKQ